MASLADLFNPTFLVLLGILLLVVALLVLYFENKMREQNHKIASMLSLVSTLAEDMNGVKMGFNQRRKTVRNSVKVLCGNAEVQSIYLDKRAEQLSVNEFVELTNSIEKVIH